MKFLHRLTLTQKILLGILPMFLLFVAASVILQNHFQEREMLEEAQTAAMTYADLIKETLVSMMVNNLEVDSTFLTKVNALQQFQSVHLHVRDLHLRKDLVTSARTKRQETKYLTHKPHDQYDGGVLETGRPMFIRKSDLFRAIIPFNATQVCQKCHTVPTGYTLGAVDLYISLARISQATRGNWERSAMIFLGFSVLAVAVASIMFSRFVSRPISRLVDATNEITKGHLDYQIPDLHHGNRSQGDDSGDAVKVLAMKFDQMRFSLKEKIQLLDKLNKSLSDRNMEIEDALCRLRQAQEDLMLSERLAVTGTMTAQLSHEINNPIHNIQSLLESSLRKIRSNPEAQELLHVALEEVSRLAKLTRQMLEVYRGSIVEYEHEIVDIGDLLKDVASVHREPFLVRNISLALEIPTTLPPVQGSRDKLKQVLINLLINAGDAIRDNGAITLAAEANGGHVRLKVSDTGAGIPQDIQPRIFDAFFTTKKMVSGVGLGLFVSYGIIQKHKGTIHVTSTVGKGSTFIIELPSAGEPK